MIPGYAGFATLLLCKAFALYGVDGAPAVNESRDTGHIYSVYRLWPNTTAQLVHLSEIHTSASKYNLNFWTEPKTVGIPVDVMVVNAKRTELENLINQTDGMKFKIIIDDVEKLIVERERKNDRNDAEKLLKDQPIDAKGEVDFNLRQYHSNSEVPKHKTISKYLHFLEDRYSTIVKVQKLGYTGEGRLIEGIKIGSVAKSAKKAIWIDAGIHSREWISVTTALYFINQLATKYDTDSQIKEYVDKLDWYILPVFNPDGYEFTRSSTNPDVRLFRKNRSRNCAGSGCCNGVDLVLIRQYFILYKKNCLCKGFTDYLKNRNFDFHWNEVGTSSDVCADNYAGRFAFSEAETKAVRDFLTPLKDNFGAFLTMHTYAQFFMYPYGHQNNTYPADVADMKNVAIQAVNAIKSMYGTMFRVGTGADVFYQASGSSSDWAKDSLGIKYSYTLELRPEYYMENGFILHDIQILPAAKETWEGVKVVADAVLKQARTPRTSSNSRVQMKTCVDSEPQCRWYASLGGCVMWKDVDQRCPSSCKVCDQDE